MRNRFCIEIFKSGLSDIISVMLSQKPLDPIDYLVIGHLAVDVTPDGLRLGGTAAYATLTARALGLRVGVVTSFAGEIPLDSLDGIPVVSAPCEHSTTFENIYTPDGRIQILHHQAELLGFHLVPDSWRTAKIVHLGPIAQEVEPSLARSFPNSFLGVTPQGFLRTWDEKGHVFPCEWPEAPFVLQNAGAAVISVEDVGMDEYRIEEMASHCRLFVVTEAHLGARVYWNGDVRHFPAPTIDQVDATGAGDIFAAAFFTRLYSTRDPWEAARVANLLASASVTRLGLESIPTPDEVRDSFIEVI